MRRLIALLVLTALTACQVGGDQRPQADYASWSVVNRDGSWTAAAEAAVRGTSLPAASPADIRSYCPGYPGLGKENRVKFWVGLLAEMAEYESDLNPQTEFKETLRDSQGNYVVSRGLLQISIESANQKRYSCGISAEQDLHDPATNIQCGAKILSSWVSTDGVVASNDGSNLGGARYWSVLRSKNSSAADIRKNTSKLRFCRS